MENGDAAASWRIWIHASRITAEMQGNVANGDPAVHLVRTISPAIYPRNQGHFGNGERFPSPGQDASSWNRCITWLTDGQWSNGGWASPLMQSSRTWDPE